MTDIGLTSYTYPNLNAGAILRWLLAALARSFRRSNQQQSSRIASSLSDQLRTDLGFENPRLQPISRFQGFEIETCIVKQSPEALQLHLTRGIERR
jgi:hypothetical protein